VINGGNTKVSDPRAYKVTAAPVTISKLHVQRFLGVGIRVQQAYPPTVFMPGRTTVEDCVVEDIATDPPLASDGTAEACYWFGNPTTARRLKGVNLRGWSVLETTSRALGSEIEDCEFTGGPNTVVVYVEHQTQGCTFRRIRTIGGYSGFKFEWSYKQTSYQPGNVGHGEMEGCWENVVEDCEIYCPGLEERSGVWVDAGNYGNVFRRCRFHGPGQALWLPSNLVDPSKPNIVEDCVFDQDGPDIVYHRRKIGWNGQ
jgi:hypothetical protein